MFNIFNEYFLLFLCPFTRDFLFRKNKKFQPQFFAFITKMMSESREATESKLNFVNVMSLSQSPAWKSLRVLVIGKR